jgi:hypothetical protein
MMGKTFDLSKGGWSSSVESYQSKLKLQLTFQESFVVDNGQPVARGYFRLLDVKGTALR